MRANTPANCMQAYTTPATGSARCRSVTRYVTENENKVPCTIANENASAVIDSSAGFAFIIKYGAATLRGLNSAAGPMARPGSRSISSRSRAGLISAVASSPIAVASISAAGQLQCAATGASTSPANAPPAGAPACLTEKIKVRCCGGAVAARILLPAGGEGPYPTPMSNAAATSNGHQPLDAISSPNTASSAPTCSMRTGPSRASTGPPNSRNKTAPRELNEDRLPTRSGAMPAPAVNSGAITTRLWFRKDATVCIPSVVASATRQTGGAVTPRAPPCHAGAIPGRLKREMVLPVI